MLASLSFTTSIKIVIQTLRISRHIDGIMAEHLNQARWSTVVCPRVAFI